MGRTIISKLSVKSSVKLNQGTGYTAQSLALVTAGKRYVICNTHGSDNSGNHVLKVTSSSYSKVADISTGHANGGTYCDKNGYVYTTSYSGGSANKIIKVWDAGSNFKYKFKVTLPCYATGIAYDPVTTDFYVSVQDYYYIFPYSAFSQGGTYKGKYTKYKKKFTDFQNQDIGGYGGIVLCCKSWDVNHSSNGNYTSYIDCYRASNGKYVGSYQTQGECESVAIDGGGRLHVLYAGHGGRYLRTMNQLIQNGISSTSSSSAITSTVNTKTLGKRILKKAKSYIGDGPSHFWDVCDYTPGADSHWCCMFIHTIFKECSMSDIMYPKNLVNVATCHAWLTQHATQIKAKNARAGDICIYGSNTHIEIVSHYEDGKIYSIGGNTGPYQSAYKGVVSRVRYYGSNPTAVFRPKYSKSSAADTVPETEEVAGTLEVSPEKLYSSANFEYAGLSFDKEESETQKAQKEQIQNLVTNAAQFQAVVADTTNNINILTNTLQLSDFKRPSTKVVGNIQGSRLPVALNPVEAPFAELTIGDYTFGVRSLAEDYPNYINGLNIVRTNGSMNEYVINLIHQVSPGRNPNFIDEILSKNSFNKIKIKYGDANSNVIFSDESALLTGSDINFNFASCNINYSVKATSSIMSVASHKVNRAAVTDKGSNIILNLLNSNTSLRNVYPAMSALYATNNNLIPTDDAVITIDAMENVNDMTYLKTIVASMKSESNKNASYYLIFRDNDFKIYELNADTAAYDASLYEVSINYPDDNQIFAFNSNVDFSWPLAYAYSGNVSDYIYSIDNNGFRQEQQISASNKFRNQSAAQTQVADNWWKQVTNFPINATLTCRGLLSPLLLMTYIKVNCYYYGQLRNTSGVYIVTGQQDSLDGNGYRSTLSLTKVAGPTEYLTIDSRIRT